MKKRIRLQKLFFLLLAISFLAACDDNDNVINPLVEKQLPTVIIEKYTPDGNDDNLHTQKSEYSYDNLGRITQRLHTYSSKESITSNTKTSIVYSEDGKVKEYEEIDLDNASMRKYICQYETNNKINIKENGQIIKTIWTDSKNRVTKVETSTMTASMNVITHTYIYEEDNNNIKRAETVDRNIIANKVDYVYDTSKKGYFHDTNTPQWVMIDIINDFGNCFNPITNISSPNPDMILPSNRTFEYEYDENSYPTKVIADGYYSPYSSIITIEYKKEK